MGNWAEYKDNIMVLERDMYQFISDYSYDFSKEEREIFCKAYELIQIRQNIIIDGIRKERRK